MSRRGPVLRLRAATLSHLPGLPLVYGVAMGIGAMSVVMLRLPLTSVLLAYPAVYKAMSDQVGAGQPSRPFGYCPTG